MRKVLIFSLVVFAVVLGGCKKKHSKNKAAAPVKKASLVLTDQQMKFVKLDTVKKMPAAEQFTAVGDVSYAEDNVVRVYPIVSGTVESVSVSLGDYVKQGQLLATLLSTDISQYQRDYNVSKSNLEVEEKDFQRAQELYKAGMLSEKELAQAKKEYSNAKSEYSEKKQIIQFYGGSVDQDALFHVKASRSGYVVERNITAGTQIRADNSTNIFTISDLKTVWIWANVHESDIAKVHEGDAVRVRTIAYPDKIFNGTINKISTVLDPSSRVVRVRTVLDNAAGLLKPEMFATVLITPQVSEKVIVVPNTSITLENNQYYVMVESAKQEFKKVQIKTGRVFHLYTEVLEGVEPGQRVVTEGSLFVLTAFNQL